MTKELLLQRRDAIVQSAADSKHVLAVLGLGSAGMGQERLDAYSDLDLWLIVEPGFKQRYVDDLAWLTRVFPITFLFKHSPSGYGVLFADDLFAEIDVFDIADLASLGFSEARILWKAAGVPESIQFSQQQPTRTERSVEALLGEALANLYIGLGRFHRGEKLSAMRFVQVYAIDQLMQLWQHIEQAQPVSQDAFSRERRVEQRLPLFAKELAPLLQGYERTPESAAAILQLLDAHFTVNPAMQQAIQRRLQEHSAS